jgi:hypothetical protein
MGVFTRLGCSIWEWDRFTSLDCEARNLWLVFYTGATSNRLVPGLWTGGVGAMSDESHMPPENTIRALDTLLAAEMVEYDPKRRVLRLTEFPDAGERPSNGSHVRGMWSRFQTVPPCQVRDAHVRSLEWLCLDSGHSEDVLIAWKETFGTVSIPVQRQRGVKRMLDQATGTDVQPSLWDPRPVSNPVRTDLDTNLSVSHLQKPLRSGFESSSTVVQNTQGNTPRKNVTPEEFSTRLTPCRTPPGVGEGVGEDLSFLLAEADPDYATADEITTSAQCPVDAGAEHHTGDQVAVEYATQPVAPRPHLSLVPAPEPTPLESFVTSLSEASGGQFPKSLTEASSAALSRTIYENRDYLRGPDRTLLWAFLRGRKQKLSPELISDPTVLRSLVVQARGWHDLRASYSESLATLGYVPIPDTPVV